MAFIAQFIPVLSFSAASVL